MCSIVSHATLCCSLDANHLCGVDNGVGKDTFWNKGTVAKNHGTFTTEAIDKLCEMLPKSSLTSLKCAAGLHVYIALFVFSAQ